jgi:hypothetical protein
MKFNCGPSLGDRYDARQRRQRDWHRWFAWRPARINYPTRRGICVWWEWVERRNDGPACEGGWNEWLYRQPGEGA